MFFACLYLRLPIVKHENQNKMRTQIAKKKGTRKTTEDRCQTTGPHSKTRAKAKNREGDRRAADAGDYSKEKTFKLHLFFNPAKNFTMGVS